MKYSGLKNANTEQQMETYSAFYSKSGKKQERQPKKGLYDYFLIESPSVLRQEHPEYEVFRKQYDEVEARVATWRYITSGDYNIEDITNDKTIRTHFNSTIFPISNKLTIDKDAYRTQYIEFGYNEKGEFYILFNPPDEEFFRDNKINSESDMGLQVLKYLQKEAEKERINNVSSDNRNAERIIEKVNNNTQLNKAEKQQVLKLYYDLTEKKVENEIQLREQSSVTAFAMDVEDGYLEALDWVIPFYEIDTGFERYIRTDYYAQKLLGLRFGINSNSVEDIKVRTENLRNDIIQSYSGFRTDFGNAVGAMIFFLPLIILLIIYIRKLTFAIVKKIKRRKKSP